MGNIWTRLDQLLLTHAPQLHSTLRPGASHLELDKFEVRIRSQIPTQLREYYLAHDGCNYEKVEGRLGLFGKHQWLPLEEVLIQWEIQEADFDTADPYHYEEDDDGWAGLPIRPWLSAPSYWLPIGWRPGVAGRLHVDLLPGPTGQIGQLVGEDIHGMSKWIVANSLAEYLTHLSNELEAGRLCVFTDEHTQQQDWRCVDGRPFVTPGFAKVFG